MSEKIIKYEFHYQDKCNMCGALSPQFKVMGRRMNVSQGRTPKMKTGISTTVVKCRKCGLIFSNPLPVPINLSDHYGISPEDYWKDKQYTIKEDYYKPKLEKYKTLSGGKVKGRSLDIGAGIGKEMSVMLKSGFDAYGIEPSESFRDIAISKMGCPSEKIKCISLEEAEFPKDHFDFITFNAVLEHIYLPSESIKKALQWLKPGGLMRIEVPSSKWLISSIANCYYKIIRTDYVTNLSPMHKPFHLYEFSERSFIENSKINGYSIELFEYYVCETFLPKMFDKVGDLYMAKTNRGMELIVWLRKQ